MRIQINKEIRNYTENIAFGLNLRQVVFAILIIISLSLCYIGISFLSDIAIIKSLLAYICVIFVVPLAFFGFYRFNGMPFEKLMVSFLKSKILDSKKLVYKTNMNYYSEPVMECLEERNGKGNED